MAFLCRRLRSIIATKNFLPLASINNERRQIHRWVAPTLQELKRREKKQGGKITNPRNTFLEWNQEAELFAFGKRLNEDFNDTLLAQAFTDRSYVIKEEARQQQLGIDFKLEDNRQLAKEGESFMRDYIQRYLEVALPRFPKEGLSGILEFLMSEETLSHVSSHLGTKDIILADTYPVSNTILANTLKALVAALHQSSGEERAAHFVRDFVITHLQGMDVNEYHHIQDPWTSLLGLIKQDVEPRLIGETAPNTLLACYRVGLYVDKKMISSGFGESIAIAKEMAAREALKKLYGTAENMRPIDFQIRGTLKDRQQQISSN